MAAGGGLPAGAAAAAERLVAGGATALVSFGLCGGLHPALRAGGLVVPAGVLAAAPNAPPLHYAADRALTSALGQVTCEYLYSGTAIASTAAAKAALFGATAATAIDLESGAVAEVAARHGLPFAVLRAVCDPADFDLPPAALLALNPQGRIQPWLVAASILRRPAQLPALIELARAAAAARAALIRRAGQVAHRGRLVL